MIKKNECKSAITIGNFDGFHLGHKKIISLLKNRSLENDLVSIVLTFEPNPKLFFRKELRLINTENQKKRILNNLGVDRVLFLNFKKFSKMSPDNFIKEILVGQFNMNDIIVGENFKFGKNREGNVKYLRLLSTKLKFNIEVVKPVIVDGIRVSSSKIRERLNAGKIEDANRMLGNLYYIDGLITEGDKIGRELGFPTINIKTDNTLLPEGVFKTKVEIKNKQYDSITNIGVRPTFSGNETKIESHILKFKKNIYGKIVRIYFEKKIRNEVKFDSSDKLIKQIKSDIKSINVDKGILF